MQIQSNGPSPVLHLARLGVFASILLSAGVFSACASGSEVPDGGTGGRDPGSTSSVTTGGDGGAGGVGGAGGAGGAAAACEPGVVEDCYTGPAGTQGVGLCVSGKRTCAPDGVSFGPCEGEVIPAAETCGTPDDDDCNGVANDMGADCACAPASVEPCYTGPGGTQDVGACKGGTRTCNELGTAWSACEGEVTPAAEVCADAEDDDCDGVACASPLWNLIFGGAGADVATNIAVDSAGNIYVGGTFSGSITIGADTHMSAGGTDAFLAKFDAQGALQWSQRFGDASDQGATGVAADPAGNVILVGYFNGVITFGPTSYTASARDAFVVKLGGTGIYVWSTRIGSSGNQKAVAVATDASSNVFVIGAFEGALACPFGNCINSQGLQDIFVYKYSAQNAQLWLKIFGDPGDQVPGGVAVDSAGNAIVVGSFKGNGVDFGGGIPLGSAGGFDVFVAKLAPNGSHVWSGRYGDPLDQLALGVAVGPMDGIALTGSFQSTINFGALDNQSKGASDIFVAKLSADGAYEWDKAYGDVADDAGQSVVFDAGGDVLVTGGFQGAVDFGGGALTSLVSYDVFLLKLTAAGAHGWSSNFGDATSQYGVSLARDPVTGSILAAVSASGTIDFGLGPLTSAGMADVALVKLSP
jgi:hypothetical protein